MDIQVTVLGIPDITSTTFDIDETGANSGFQLAVVDEIPANVVWTLDDANPGAEQGEFALSANGDLTFLNGVPAYDGTAAENNDYEVRVKTVDENGLSSTKLITVTVNDALAPTIDDIPTNIANAAQFTMTEGDTAVKTFTASDESAGTVYWQLSGTDSADFAITDALSTVSVICTGLRQRYSLRITFTT